LDRPTSKGRVRIIGGQWRGRRVEFPSLPGLRPTPDRVRETLFNWLAPWMAGTRVLDLFAGSGVLGFEALSRGAASVTAVELDRRAAASLRAAARALEARDYSLVEGDAAAFLDRTANGPFDLVFMDPPHTSPDYEKLCRMLDANGKLSPRALVYLEFANPGSADFSTPEPWQLHRTAQAGHLTYQLWQAAD